MDYIGKYPDGLGKFGEFGGMFAPEILMPALNEANALKGTRYADLPKLLKIIPETNTIILCSEIK